MEKRKEATKMMYIDDVIDSMRMLKKPAAVPKVDSEC